MIARFQLGQLVRLIAIPASLSADTDDLPTTTLFQACIGRTFAVADIEHGVVAL